jgi:hypothetical protein
MHLRPDPSSGQESPDPEYSLAWTPKLRDACRTPETKKVTLAGETTLMFQDARVPVIGFPMQSTEADLCGDGNLVQFVFIKSNLISLRDYIEKFQLWNSIALEDNAVDTSEAGLLTLTCEAGLEKHNQRLLHNSTPLSH